MTSFSQSNEFLTCLAPSQFPCPIRLYIYTSLQLYRERLMAKDVRRKIKKNQFDLRISSVCVVEYTSETELSFMWI